MINLSLRLQGLLKVLEGFLWLNPCVLAGFCLSGQMKWERRGSFGKPLETFWKRISNRFDKCFVVLKLQKTNGFMHKELILLAFQKGMLSLEEKGMAAPSKSAIAELLSDHIDVEYTFQFGERRLRVMACRIIWDIIVLRIGFSERNGWKLKKKNLRKRRKTVFFSCSIF